MIKVVPWTVFVYKGENLFYHPEWWNPWGTILIYHFSTFYLLFLIPSEWPSVFRFGACSEVICSTIPDSSVRHGNFWHLECSLLDCINYISSSIVIEIPVSSAWCVNVIQISFYSKKEKKREKKNNITWVLFVHKAFWKLHLTIHFCSPVAVLESSWKWTF